MNSNSSCREKVSYLPLSNDDEVVLNSLVVDVLVLFEYGHGYLGRANGRSGGREGSRRGQSERRRLERAGEDHDANLLVAR